MIRGCDRAEHGLNPQVIVVAVFVAVAETVTILASTRGVHREPPHDPKAGHAYSDDGQANGNGGHAALIHDEAGTFPSVACSSLKAKASDGRFVPLRILSMLLRSYSQRRASSAAVMPASESQSFRM